MSPLLTIMVFSFWNCTFIDLTMVSFSSFKEYIGQYHLTNNIDDLMGLFTKKASKYYPDIIIFLVMIPIISGINYYLTYSKIKLNWYLVYRYTIDTLQGYLAWLAVRELILFLDKKLPYEAGLLKRILIQWVTTTMLGLFIIAASTEILSIIFIGKWAPIDFYTTDMVIIGIWFFFINAIYLGLYYYNTLKRAELKIAAEPQIKSDGYKVKEGKREIIIDFEDLAGFYVDLEYSVVLDNKGKSYYTLESLDNIGKLIPKDTFFRLNRKFILNRSAIVGFERIENGKLSVLTKKDNIFPSEITVSRDKAPLFKKWF